MSEPKPTLRLALLISGGGSTMTNIARHIAGGELHATIALVIASNDTAASTGIERAGQLGLPVEIVIRKQFADTAAFSDRVWSLIREAKADLVILGGFLSLLNIPDDYRHRVMNIHPALLPDFGGKGMFGHHVHEAVIKSGVKESGCTVHFADNQYDHGPIILQRRCPVLPTDTPDDLARRVMAEERIAYPHAIELFAQGKIAVKDNHVIIVN
ncbi:MAG: phosphoribosylglycinamide formyltransferase [Phycisphaerales bacterium]